MSILHLNKINELKVNEYIIRDALLLKDGRILCQVSSFNDRGDEFMYLFIINSNTLQVEQIITGLLDINHLIQLPDGRLFFLAEMNEFSILDNKYNTFILTLNKVIEEVNDYGNYYYIHLKALSHNRICFILYPIFAIYNLNDLKLIAKIADNEWTHYSKIYLHAEVEIEERQILVIFSVSSINVLSLVTYKNEISIRKPVVYSYDRAIPFLAKKINKRIILFTTDMGTLRLFNYINYTIEAEISSLYCDLDFKTFCPLNSKTVLIFTEFENNMYLNINDILVILKNNIMNDNEKMDSSHCINQDEARNFYPIDHFFYIKKENKCICIDDKGIISYNIVVS